MRFSIRQHRADTRSSHLPADPALAPNLLVGFSAAIVSNHYMADVIGGIGIAGFTMSLVLLVVRSGHGLSFRRLTTSVGDT